MDIIYSLVGILLALGVLVTVHEFGHFGVARLCGVRVLRFSVGFGKALWSWRDKQGTEFVIAPIPLGGYVKMFGESEDASAIALEDRRVSFVHKNVWQRLAIVLAGPAANLVLAVVCYALLFVMGTSYVVPVVDGVVANSPAEDAGFVVGDRIVAVDGERVRDWQAVNLAVFRALGNRTQISVETEREQRHYLRTLSLAQFEQNKGVLQDLVRALGIMPYPARLEPVIGTISAGGRAEAAGLLPGDLVLEANGISIESWNQWVQVVRRHAEVPLYLRILRDGRHQSLTLIPENRRMEGQQTGYIGAAVMLESVPKDMIQVARYSVVGAWWPALVKTWSMVALTLDGMKKLLFGVLSIKNIGGPVTIGQVAGQSLASGFTVFVAFLAYLNVSLAVINLLPIPMLDGGHATFYLAEIIARKPLPETFRHFAMKLGFVLLVFFMSIALFNDFTRLFAQF